MAPWVWVWVWVTTLGPMGYPHHSLCPPQDLQDISRSSLPFPPDSIPLTTMDAGEPPYLLVVGIDGLPPGKNNLIYPIHGHLNSWLCRKRTG
jgi:hypothetical protein